MSSRREGGGRETTPWKTTREREREGARWKGKPGVSRVLLSRGDLILIYSRVPNKLVFAVVTSRTSPPPPPPLPLSVEFHMHADREEEGSFGAPWLITLLFSSNALRGGPGIRISFPLSPRCTYLPGTFFPSLSLSFFLCSKRREEKGSGGKQTENPSTPYNCQLVWGYLIAIRLLLKVEPLKLCGLFVFFSWRVVFIDGR